MIAHLSPKKVNIVSLSDDMLLYIAPLSCNPALCSSILCFSNTCIRIYKILLPLILHCKQIRFETTFLLDIWNIDIFDLSVLICIHIRKLPENQLDTLLRLLKEGVFAQLESIFVTLDMSKKNCLFLLAAITPKSLPNLTRLSINLTCWDESLWKSANDVFMNLDISTLTILSLSMTHIGRTDTLVHVPTRWELPNRMRNIAYLDLKKNNLGDAGLKQVSIAIACGCLVHLYHLDVSENFVSDEGCIVLRNALCSAVDVHDLFVHIRPKGYNLTHLCMQRNLVTDIGLQAFLVSTRVISCFTLLNLSDNYLTYQMLSSHGSFTKLEILSMQGNNLGNAGFNTFIDALMEGKFPCLRSADLSGNDIDDSRYLLQAVVCTHFMTGKYTIDSTLHPIPMSKLRLLHLGDNNIPYVEQLDIQSALNMSSCLSLLRVRYA